ncbi:MAG TPA: hypothetical protein VEX64_06010 [Pyrinomonadaceae bacterium]|nr:hypothetical protein [Pyrinomonadaceae bacterium]
MRGEKGKPHCLRQTGKRLSRFSLVICHSFLLFAVIVHAQNSPCAFDKQTLQFTGTPLEQALCLLRPVKISGNLGSQLKKLPSPLEKLIGKPIEIQRTKFREFLRKNKIEESEIGGSLDSPLSKALLPDGREISALYFLIHDTSSPYLKDEPFPAEINEKDWRGNDLRIWKNQPVAHVFVNRAGESATIVEFGEPVKKGFGTKFARDFLKQDAKGLQIHIELVQPRRRDPLRKPETNDAIAPTPGFTAEQYDRLALLYAAASVRRGLWLIPAFHAATDAGIKDAHDDPQNFELKIWAKSLAKLLKKIG